MLVAQTDSGIERPKSTATLPSSARESLALAVTAPLMAVVFASKLPPIVIGQITRTSPWPHAPRISRDHRRSGEGDADQYRFHKGPHLSLEQIAQERDGVMRTTRASSARFVRLVDDIWLQYPGVGAVSWPCTMVPTIDRWNRTVIRTAAGVD